MTIGANYWASHAGIAMWREWRPDIVQKDFGALASHGIRWLRVFPLWPDFQPILLLRAAHGEPVEFRHGETPLPDASGVCPLMLDRLTDLASLAEKNGLKLLVALVTGWMSGRLFVPPALEGLNPVTDASALIWQVRLVKRIVGHCRRHPSILAWDLGNECNVMGRASASESLIWTATIANAIRAADSSRPVISGMHSLQADPAAAWSIRGQGEFTDVLTTHPYPLFTPHCNREPVGTMRPLLHATAETLLYAGLSERPAIVEETGALGPMCASDDATAKAARASCFSLWAHGINAMLWWCAHDQGKLTMAPYDWVSCERELGLLGNDGGAKPMLLAMDEAQAAINKLPFKNLPDRRVDAVCILTPEQDAWGAAFTSFILAKQAGFDLSFSYSDAPLRQSSLYIIPSVAGMRGFPRRLQEALLEKAREGASVYISWDDAVMSHFRETTGMEVISRSERRAPCRVRFLENDTGYSDNGDGMQVDCAVHWRLQAHEAEILACGSDGNPLFSVFHPGKGRVYFLALPLETSLARRTGTFIPEQPQSLMKVYEIIGRDIMNERIIKKHSPWIGITEHPLADGTHAAVLINYHSEPVSTTLAINPKYQLTDACLGPAPAGGRISLEGNATSVLLFRSR